MATIFVVDDPPSVKDFRDGFWLRISFFYFRTVVESSGVGRFGMNASPHGGAVSYIRYSLRCGGGRRGGGAGNRRYRGTVPDFDKLA